MSVNRLPDLSLLLIFRFIENYRERTKLERVCRRWRQLLLKDGWKHVRKIELRDANLIGPIGARCGDHLVECRFVMVDIDSTLIRLIAEHFRILKHLVFQGCKLLKLDVSALESFRGLGARLRSLTFCDNFETNYRHQPNYQLVHHFPHLQHLGLHIPEEHNLDSLPSHFFANLRSLYLSCSTEPSSPGVERMLTKVQMDSARLSALYFNNDYFYGLPPQFLSQISILKNLRLLRICLKDEFEAELLCSCLTNLPQLLGLHLRLSMELLPNMLPSPTFRSLSHLGLSLTSFGDYKSIGLLSKFAPQLRSLILDHSELVEMDNSGLDMLFDLSNKMADELLKIAYNGILECLVMSYVNLSVEMLGQLIKLCPNLRSIVTELDQTEQHSQLSDLRHIVADQWHAGTRKYLPLRLNFWFYGGHTDFSCSKDPFLSVEIVHFDFGPPNHLLDAVFRDEVFNVNDRGWTPSFVTELYTSSSA